MKFLSFALFMLICVFTLAGILTAQSFPDVIKFTAPLYPPAALAVRAEGDVNVLLVVNEDGKVIQSQAISGHKLLQKAAEFTARNWTFSRNQGTHYITIRFLFRLPDNRDRDSARIIGQYTLQFTKKPVRIRQTVSYQTAAQVNE
jgi:TonB family protein